MGLDGQSTAQHELALEIQQKEIELKTKNTISELSAKFINSNEPLDNIFNSYTASHYLQSVIKQAAESYAHQPLPAKLNILTHLNEILGGDNFNQNLYAFYALQEIREMPDNNLQIKIMNNLFDKFCFEPDSHNWSFHETLMKTAASIVTEIRNLDSRATTRALEGFYRYMEHGDIIISFKTFFKAVEKLEEIKSKRMDLDYHQQKILLESLESAYCLKMVKEHSNSLEFTSRSHYRKKLHEISGQLIELKNKHKAELAQIAKASQTGKFTVPVNYKPVKQSRN